MGGVSSLLKTERNNICVANVSDQSAMKYKEKFSTESLIDVIITYKDIPILSTSLTTSHK